MRILIVGLGYAGTRFRHAFEDVWRSSGERGEIAVVGRVRRDRGLPFFGSVAAALAEVSPDVVVLSVNDVHRAEVSEGLCGYRGFLLCEKPLVCPSDDRAAVSRRFAGASGFCLNLIERYSAVSGRLRALVAEDRLELLRANFTWGKDRLGDHRPTCGVTSEIIHALDLIRHVSGATADYEVEAAHGVRSDFSVSGPAVLDSVSMVARLGGAAVMGYASFVNASRRREINLTFARRSGGLVFANLQFDEPAWDDDHLRVWEVDGAGERVLVEEHVGSERSASGHLGLVKLTRLAGDVAAAARGRPPAHGPFADLDAAARLQKTLNTIHRAAEAGPLASFSRYGPVRITTEAGSWERLG